MGVFTEIRTYPVRFLKSCGLFSCFLCMGLSMGIVGPTLLDFKVKTQSPLKLAALIFPVRAGGYAFGTFVSGMFYHKMDVQILVSVTMAVSGVITLIIPFISEIRLLLVAFAVVGLSLGLYSSGGNMWVLDLWGKGNPPFLQAAHFMLGFGAFAAPLIARPFLRTEGILLEDPGECHELPEPPVTVMSNVSLFDAHFFDNGSSSVPPPPPPPINSSDINLIVPFGVIALIEFANAIFFIAMKMIYPNDGLHPSRLPQATAPPYSNHSNREADDDDDEIVSRKLSLIGLSRSSSLGRSFTTRASKRIDRPPLEQVFHRNSIRSAPPSSSDAVKALSTDVVADAKLQHAVDGGRKEITDLEENQPTSYNAWRMLVIVLAVLFMHIYYGLEIIFGTLLTTFTNKSPLHLETTEGATVTSIYWGTFAFWRLPTVFYVDYLGPIKTIFFNLIILVTGNILLVPWGATERWAVYTGSGLVGLGASPIFASMFGVLETFFPVTPKIASFMITASMLGEFVFPSIISPFISCTPNVFLWVALFCSLSVVFLFLIITSICYLKLNTHAS